MKPGQRTDTWWAGIPAPEDSETEIHNPQELGFTNHAQSEVKEIDESGSVLPGKGERVCATKPLA